MATLKDVAQDAGVAVATVSCCLSGNRNVKQETKMRIMDSVEKLKYIPNASARRLKRNVSDSIGVILTGMDGAFESEIFRGISFCLQKGGFTPSVAFTDNLAFRECGAIEKFVGENVAGLLLVTSMPENTGFFQKRVMGYGIPSVFIEHRPKGIDANFVGFENRETVCQLTKQLLERCYRKIALVTGPKHFMAEADSMEGYKKAFTDSHIAVDGSFIWETNMSKEDSFKTALDNWHMEGPEAIITTSEEIALGVLEALHIQNISVTKDVRVITLCQERWNQTSHVPGVIYVPRSAYVLGEKAAALLLSNMKDPDLPPKTELLKDQVLKETTRIPTPCKRTFSSNIKKEAGKQIHVLMADLTTSRCARLLSGYCRQSTGISVVIDLLPHNFVLEGILTDMNRADHQYDIYMYDNPWLPYMVQNGLLADISSYAREAAFDAREALGQGSANCKLGDRYYGIPFSSGSHIMFYRKDLFSDHRLAKLYARKYELPLRPPKTWDEFNHVAEFFTRSYNPDSPTLYGTSVAGIMDEELVPEILIRMWSYGGNLWDAYKKATLYTAQNVRAFRCLLQTLSYVEKSPMETSIMNTVDDFSFGKTAVLLTYSEYASRISRSLYQNVIGNIGYERVPGRYSLCIGWALGVNPNTPRMKEALAYFDWLREKRTGQYMAIMGAQLPFNNAGDSSELLKIISLACVCAIRFGTLPQT